MQTNSHLLKDAWQYLRAGRLELATERCLEGLVKSPDDSELHYVLALCDRQAGNFADAISRFERVASQDDQHVGARVELGRLYAERGEGETACRWFDECLRLMPNHAPARTLRARVDQRAGRRSAALDGLKTALRADPDHVPALLTLSEMMLQDRDPDAALRYASRAVELEPDNVSAQLNMARVFMVSGQLAFAERCLDNAAEKDPENPQVYWTRAELCQRTERYPEAVAALETARRLGLETPRMLRQLAANLVLIGRHDEAAQALESVLDSTMEQDVVIGLAELYANSGDASALQALAERVGEEPAGVGQWVRALASEAAGSSDDGLAMAMDLLESGDEGIRLRSRLLAARLALRLGRHEEVADVLGPLVADPGLGHGTHWTISGMLRQSGHAEMAVRTLEEVLQRESLGTRARAKTRVMLVDLLDRLGEYRNAAEHFEKAAWQRPYLGEAAYRPARDNRGQSDLSAIRDVAWPQAEPEQARAYPVFVTGWPFSGRELIISALSLSERVHVLPPDDWARRRSHLQLPVDIRTFGALDSERCHLMRRHFLRGSPRGKRTLETAHVQAPDLAQLARVFPATVVINPVVAEEYLALQWRLAGYAGIAHMVEAWKRDQDMLAELRSELPLRFFDCSLEQLLTDPEPLLLELCQVLGLAYDGGMGQALEQTASLVGYRPPHHWKHYQQF